MAYHVVVHVLRTMYGCKSSSLYPPYIGSSATLSDKHYLGGIVDNTHVFCYIWVYVQLGMYHSLYCSINVIEALVDNV